MAFIDFTSKKKVKIWEGISGTFHHSPQLTFGHLTLDKGIALPEHSHMHEQWTHIISGELEFTINGETTVLQPGMAVHIPSFAPHSAKAITACKVIDCFLPVREDFIELEKKS